MWKLMIADDEPRIRRGLAKVLPWEELGIEVIGEAEDGQDALEKARLWQPDLLFVDICMPFMDGLAFIEELRRSPYPCLIIVITGHDEFRYAQAAVKLGVFDFILKPVNKSHLREVVEKALQSLAQNKSAEERSSWANKQLQSNSLLIRDTFLRRWVQGLLNPEEVQTNLDYLQLGASCTRLAVFKIVQSTDVGTVRREWNRDLLEFAVKNIIEDVLYTAGPHVVFNDERGHIMVLSPVGDEAGWYRLASEIQTNIESHLQKMVLTAHREIRGRTLELDRIYTELVRETAHQGALSPVVLLARKYMEQAYSQPGLSLQEVADHVRVSPTYLSKLLKKEIGQSFIDYLTEVRIHKAMLFMNEPGFKVYEIAEKVGYSSQHYFSSAFKKMTGVSPLSYRKGTRS